MTSNIVLLYPDIPFRSVQFSSDGVDTLNLVTGSRSDLLVNETPGTSNASHWGLKEDEVANADYICIARLDIPIGADSADVTVRVKGDTDPTFAVSDTFTDTVGAGDLVGPQLEDYIAEIPGGTFTVDYPNWRVQIETTDAIQFKYSKVYLGRWFDFGRDPVFPERSAFETRGNFSRLNNQTISLEWEGIGPAVKTDFSEKIDRFKDMSPVFVYDRGNCVLDGQKLLHCQIQDVRYSVDDNENYNIRVAFLELI